MKLRLPLLAVVLAALSVAMPAVSASGAARPTAPTGGVAYSQPTGASARVVGSFTSPNWAGWMDLAVKNSQLYKVTAQFKVPTTTCPVANATTYFWVGLDGWTDKTVEQAGVGALCDIHSGSGYKPKYFDWYEMYPNQPVPKFSVQPGDIIVATVSYDSANAKYYLQITDKTRSSASFKIPKPCPSGSSCGKSSAEVITEDPGGGPGQGHFLADFHSVAFSHVQVTSRNGTVGGLGGNAHWTANKIVMEYQNKVMARPSARNTALNGFTVAFKSKG